MIETYLELFTVGQLVLNALFIRSSRAARPFLLLLDRVQANIGVRLFDVAHNLLLCTGVEHVAAFPQ